MRIIYLLGIATALLTYVSTALAETPQWALNVNRQVIGGDIVQVGVNDGYDRELTVFLARNVAVKALIQSCGGVANKAIVIEKMHTESNGIGYKSYVQAYIPSEACEYSKAHKFDGTVKNDSIAEEQAMYDRYVEKQALPHEEENTNLKKDIMKEVKDYVRQETDTKDKEIDTLQNQVQSTEAENIRLRRKLVGKHVRMPTNQEWEGCKARLKTAVVARENYLHKMQKLTGLSFAYGNGLEQYPEFRKINGNVEKIYNECENYARMKMYGDNYVPDGGFVPANYEQ